MEDQIIFSWNCPRIRKAGLFLFMYHTSVLSRQHRCFLDSTSVFSRKSAHAEVSVRLLFFSANPTPCLVSFSSQYCGVFFHFTGHRLVPCRLGNLILVMFSSTCASTNGLFFSTLNIGTYKTRMCGENSKKINLEDKEPLL